MDKNSANSSRGPLNRTIHERQKQAAEREAAAKRSTIEYLAVPPAPPKTMPRRPTQTSKRASDEPESIGYKKVATQTLQVVKERTGWRRREFQFAALILVGVVGLLGAMGGMVVSGRVTPPPPTATLVPLPDVTVRNVTDYMKQAGIPIANVQPLTVPDNVWQANQGVRFTVQTTDGSTTFLLLSYDSDIYARQDASRSKSAALYSQWTAVQVSNVLLLAAPGSPSTIVELLVAQLNNELVLPYRAATPTVTATR